MFMPARTIIYKTTFLSFLLSGCANSLYFYETEKFSLTVEARPDSTQPVQGNLGIKQRVGLIVPGQSADNDNGKDLNLNKGSNNGEALSSFSSFNLKIDPNGFIVYPILIQTAFVTGEAAKQLDEDPEKTAQVAKAIAITGVSTKLPPLNSYAICISNSIKADSIKFSRFKEIMDNESFEGLTDDEWKEYGPDIEKCGVDQLGFDDSLRKELQEEMKK